ncbi:MAG: sulfatase-like hydrolase/transferase, partial [Anditalea sp.]
MEDTVAGYNKMVEVMDKGVGKIMQALRDNELEENTLVFFISDNGAEVFENNGGLNGSKGALWEGGQRVPGIAYWKGRIDPSESTETILTMGLLPTLLEKACLLEVSKSKGSKENGVEAFDGRKDTLLFNLENDLMETRNLADDQPEVLK